MIAPAVPAAAESLYKCDAANAKEWLNLSETQRARLRTWVIDQCRDPIGNPTQTPQPPAADV